MNYVGWYIQKRDIEKLAYSIATRIQERVDDYGSVTYKFEMGSITVIFLNDWGEVYNQVAIPENIFNNPDLVDSWVSQNQQKA